MKNVYLTKYSVEGIKAIDKRISLSFYKKTVSKNPNTRDYNIKGIYGMNGSGKTGIITSIKILKNLLTNESYLNNPIIQKNLDSMINKRLKYLSMSVEYLAKNDKEMMLFRYEVILVKNEVGQYVISSEELSSKKATTKSDSMATIFKVVDGEITIISNQEDKNLSEQILTKTRNLLSKTSLCALFYEKILIPGIIEDANYSNTIWMPMLTLWLFGMNLHVSLENSDDHREHILKSSLNAADGVGDVLIKYFVELDKGYPSLIESCNNLVSKSKYKEFEKMIDHLYDFLRIFKPDLKGIEIDKKEDEVFFICSLVMVYDSYKIHAEFESTGIKKLIRLFAYLKEMVRGGIVFIDELDSNLHDVYLCALLEYLMEYGDGQLCFTTHNVGPMDILKRRKKSIDFLSEDCTIYPWTKNGNYSPSNLYRSGMIEGSPFNVDSIDFIGVFNVNEEDK